MRLILTTLPVAVLIGYVAGGRLSNLASARLRFPLLALAGIVLQFLPVGGTYGYLLLVGSFAFLLAFAIANARGSGFALIYVGLALNLTVIAVNRGMPVTEHALLASGQEETLRDLELHGGSKHHLATEEDQLLFLGDVIAVPAPIRQAISVGDIFAHLGVAWLVVRGMRRRGTPQLASAAA